MVAWVLNLWNYVPSDVVRKFIAASKSAVDYRDWATSNCNSTVVTPADQYGRDFHGLRNISRSEPVPLPAVDGSVLAPWSISIASIW